MKVAVVESKENKRVLEIEVPEKEVKESFDRVLKKIAKNITIKGFRKGKAPMQLIERNVNEEAMHKDVLEDLIPRAYEEALYKEDIHPITIPEFPEIGKLEKEKPYTFKISFEIKPQIELKEYKEFQINQDKHEIREEHVEKTLKNLQRNAGKLTNAEEGKALESGDYAIVDFESFIETDKPLKNFKKGLIQIREDKNFPGLVENLTGKKKGDTAQFQIKEDEKNLTFKFVIHEIKREELPELNDDFAKEVSKFETLEELKKEIFKNLEEAEENGAKNEAGDKILEEIIKKITEPTSQNMLNYEMGNIVNDLQKQLHQRNLTIEDYLKARNITEEKLKEELMPQAEKFAKVELAIDAIAHKENITVTEEDIKTELEKFAKNTNQEAKKVRETMEKNKTMNMFRYSLLRKKVMDFLFENNKINYNTLKEPKKEKEADNNG